MFMSRITSKQLTYSFHFSANKYLYTHPPRVAKNLSSCKYLTKVQKKPKRALKFGKID